MIALLILFLIACAVIFMVFCALALPLALFTAVLAAFGSARMSRQDKLQNAQILVELKRIEAKK